jgi:retinol dehydrogenase 12
MATDGKTCVVTGATSGIGRAMATELARRGVRIGLVARDRAKADATVAEIGEAAPDAAVDVFLADLSLLAEVRRLAEELHGRYRQVDVLVNNAGVHTYEPQSTSEGYEAMVATNYLGPFLLTNLVAGLLRAAAPSRVVVTASEAHRMARGIKLDRLGKPWRYSRLGSFPAYGATKLMDVLFTQELALRWSGTDVTANCFCPGLVATGLARENRALARAQDVFVRTPLVRDSEQGATMGVRLAADSALAGVSGEFFTSTPGAGLFPAVAARRDPRLQQALWDRTAELVGLGAGASEQSTRPDE